MLPALLPSGHPELPSPGSGLHFPSNKVSYLFLSFLDYCVIAVIKYIISPHPCRLCHV